MKIRDLRHLEGRAWPPDWTAARGEKLLASEAGVLADVRLLQGGSILLRMMHQGRDYYGMLVWDHPPETAVVAETLTAAIGRPVKELSDVEV